VLLGAQGRAEGKWRGKGARVVKRARAEGLLHTFRREKGPEKNGRKESV